MPPKKGKRGKEVEEPAAPTQVVRPPTPNDFRIVATVKSLQNLANVETKWKNRLNHAAHDEATIRAKIARVNQLIGLCEKGIAQCTAAVDAIVDDQYNMVSTDPQQLVAWQQGIPSPASGGQSAAADKPAKGGGSGKSGGKAADKGKGANAAAAAAPSASGEASLFPAGYDAAQDPALASVVPQKFFANRNRQRAALRTMLQALYSVPRLSKERQVPRPASPMDMQHEVEEATRLATPISELLAMQQASAASADKKKPGALTKSTSSVNRSRGGKDAKKGSPVDAQSILDDNASAADSEVVQALTGDLTQADCLLLPVPRGLDSKVVHRVQLQRSRRLRLEASIDLFKSELPKLEQRLRGVEEMSQVGNYSLSAVAPEIAKFVEEESSLQRVRVTEDEAFQSRRAATPSTITSPQGRRGRGSAAAE